MQIRLAQTDEEIAACCPVMRELRPQIPAASFVARVRFQEQTGYLLAGLWEGGDVLAVAGFRIIENLAWGRFLYVDDLVTLAGQRSRGHGKALLAWLTAYARGHGCEQLHLDSGVQRQGAHRFYAREGMELSCHHYQIKLPASP
jgi:GNAT superfamily N-acetyltransferase